MKNELDTLIVLKYGEPSIHKDYIKTLPEAVSKRLGNGWPFITVGEVRLALIAYEQGEEVYNGLDKLKPPYL